MSRWREADPVEVIAAVGFAATLILLAATLLVVVIAAVFS